MPNPKSRMWCFTLNNYSDDDVSRLKALDLQALRYTCVGKEVGDSGTPHLQGFLYFKSAVRLQSVKRVVGDRAHCEIARGNVEQNFTYCTKDGDFFEVGERPLFQSEKGAAEKERYKKAFAFARSGDMDALIEECPDIAMRHYHTIKRIRYDVLTERKLGDTVEKHEWYYGPAGTGKSRKARAENPDAYLKNCNKWWCGYVDQDVVIVDDFDQAHSVLVHHLKHWADRYPYQAEVKGSAFLIRPRKIIVTSNYHPKDIWTDPRDLDPILRRFRVTHFPSLGSVPINPPNVPPPQSDPNGVEESKNQD